MRDGGKDKVLIATLTLNPAIDKILYVDKFEKNITTRINRIVETVGGKGTHVSVNLKMMGVDNVAFGIAHGHTGSEIVRMMRGFKIDTRFIEKAEHNSRTNYLLAESTGDSTLITEKGVLLSESDIDEVVALMRSVLKKGDYLALSGDASNYPNPFVYNEIMEKMRGMGVLYFLDTSGKTLKKCVESKPFLIKPNLDELAFLCEREITGAIGDVVEAIASLERLGIENIAVSLGEGGSVARLGREMYRVTPPKIDPVNTVGCGDCFLAGLLYGFGNKLSNEEILRYATAASAAAAECELSVGFDAGRASGLLSGVTIEKLK